MGQPLMSPTPHELTAEIHRRAAALGFDLVGIAPAGPSAYREYLRRWLEGGQAGEMAYLRERFEERTDPAKYLPGASSVICVAMNYHVPLDPAPEAERPYHGRVARYALGDDYHELIRRRLWTIADWLRETVPGARTKTAVDTAPVMEKELAVRAGIGWIGKNTCLVNPQAGSWLLLGQIITTVDLPTDTAQTDHCGTCTRCIDACPTAAITAPYQLDARRCISYLTIEHAGDIQADLRSQIGDWLFGCDICQDVCPFNARAPVQTDAALRPHIPTGTLDVRQVLGWSTTEFNRALRGTAMKRVKLPVLQRNAAIVTDNLRRRR
jgi:epoxyqueuosine reductase